MGTEGTGGQQKLLPRDQLGRRVAGEGSGRVNAWPRGYTSPIEHLTQSLDLFHNVGIPPPPHFGVFLAHFTEEGLEIQRSRVSPDLTQLELDIVAV